MDYLTIYDKEPLGQTVEPKVDESVQLSDAVDHSTSLCEAVLGLIFLPPFGAQTDGAPKLRHLYLGACHPWAREEPDCRLPCLLKQGAVAMGN